MTTQPLTYSAVVEMMDRSYTLVYLDHSNNLDSHTQIIGDCIRAKSPDTLFEQIGYWYDEAESGRVAEIIEELKALCTEQGYTEEEIEEVFDTHIDTLRDDIANRDDSNIIETLLKNTSPMPIRIEMHSNFDCINSHHFEGSYSYDNSYFGDMVNALNLNPRKVKGIFEQSGVECFGEFPDKAERNGEERVSYLSFATEISNSVSPANLLTFMATINVAELFEAGFEVESITIPKGNSCGLYSSSQGGGSIMEMELERDVTLHLKGVSKFDHFDIAIDEDSDSGYSLQDVYGVMTSFFGKPITINPHKADE
ncbi:MAG: hypothetical protein R3Y66_08340 [Rikenellaceae bacterium]